MTTLRLVELSLGAVLLAACSRAEPSPAPASSAAESGPLVVVPVKAPALQLAKVDDQGLARWVKRAAWNLNASGKSAVENGAYTVRVTAARVGNVESTWLLACGDGATTRAKGRARYDALGCSLGVEVRHGVRALDDESKTELEKLLALPGE